MSKNGLILLTPTSIAYTGTSATIGANGSVSFTACSVLSLNGVFTSDYDNYMVVCRHTGGASGWQQQARLRASGVDESSASNYYTWQTLYAGSTTIGKSRVTSSAWERTGVGGPHTGFFFYIYGPYLGQPTAIRSLSHVNESGYTVTSIYDQAGTHSLSNSYDGFTWSQQNSGAGSPSGRIAVYGMRK